MMAPTAAMALNGALAAQYAGTAVPLAFVLAFATIGAVAFAFVTFARTYASAASVGEFNARGLGPLAGRLSAWALLLVYVLFTVGGAAECGGFAVATLAYAGREIAWLPIALATLGIAGYIGVRPARTSSRAMLAIEGISIAAIVVLSAAIVVRGGRGGNSLVPFLLPHTPLGGLGLAIVFSLLSFAGFEGAAVLGEESLDPKTTIPRALTASVVVSGLLFIFIGYAQSIGFGLDRHGVADYAASASPLGDLALRNGGPSVAVAISLGATISAFAATLASATGAARLLYAFSRDGRLPTIFARVHTASGTPATAFAVVLAVGAAGTIGFALGGISGTATFAACGTVAVLALIPIYGAVQVSALRLFGRSWSIRERAIPIVALLLLGATFVANVVPIPAGLAAWYPAFVVGWLVAGALLLRDRSTLESARALP